MQQRTHPISIIPHKTKKSYHQVLCAKYDMLRDTQKTEYEFNFLAAKIQKRCNFEKLAKIILLLKFFERSGPKAQVACGVREKNQKPMILDFEVGAHIFIALFFHF